MKKKIILSCCVLYISFTHMHAMEQKNIFGYPMSDFISTAENHSERISNNTMQLYYPQQDNNTENNQINNAQNKISAALVKKVKEQQKKMHKTVNNSIKWSSLFIAATIFWYGYSGLGHDYGIFGGLIMLINGLHLYDKILNHHDIEITNTEKIIDFLQNQDLIADEYTNLIQIDE